MNSKRTQPELVLGFAACSVVIFCSSCFDSALGQDHAAPKLPASVQPVSISDEPRSIDPVSFVPGPLAAKVTIAFDDEPLKNVLQWLQSQNGINLLIDTREITSVKELDIRVRDELNDAPLYLLLNRLSSVNIGWYEHDGSILITSLGVSRSHTANRTYHLGDLFDTGYSPQETIRAIARCCGGNWGGDNDSTGGRSISLIGDVVFVRQSDEIHREIAGLLAALRRHGRRTLTMDVPQHAAIRNALEQSVSVDFEATPLNVALRDLSVKSGIVLRIDSGSAARGSNRLPVTLKAADQKLSRVLQNLLSGSGLNWCLRDGALWVVNSEVASQHHQTAVYDVRDLCSDRDEAIALKEAIAGYVQGIRRSENDRSGAIVIPKTGVLVLRQSESVIEGVLQLLQEYRVALRESKNRSTMGSDSNEIVTGYYRMPTAMAGDLERLIQASIAPESWMSPGRPNAVGMISAVTVEPTVTEIKGSAASVSNVVLVIRQSRTAHRAIGKLIQTLSDSKNVDTDAAVEPRESIRPVGFGKNLIPVESK